MSGIQHIVMIDMPCAAARAAKHADATWLDARTRFANVYGRPGRTRHR